MDKVSSADKMRIQTLHEQGYGAKRIVAAYLFKNWKLMTVKNICRIIDSRGSATERKAGSGRPKLARSVANVDHVEELICSQEEQSSQHLSTREIAAELGIRDRSVWRIAKNDLGLNAFRRVPAQVINANTKQKRLHRSTGLLRRLSVHDVKRVFFTDEKKFSTLLSATRMTESGRAARKLTSILNVFSSSARSLRHM